MFSHSPKQSARITAALTIGIAATKAGSINCSGIGKPKFLDLDPNGFEYDRFGHKAPCKAAERLEWLRRQRRYDAFQPQPYEQLARVFRTMGHDAEARKVAIAKQIDHRKYGRLGVWGWLKNYFLGITVGYGYKPWLGMVWLAGLIMCGGFVFHEANKHGIMTPTTPAIYLPNTDQPRSTAWSVPSEYPAFSPLVYSLQTAVPVINLRQAEAWIPSPRGDWSRNWMDWLVLFWMRTQIILGWIFTTATVGAIAGIIRKD